MGSLILQPCDDHKPYFGKNKEKNRPRTTTVNLGLLHVEWYPVPVLFKESLT